MNDTISKIDTLQKTFTTVNDWLKFAEAKNGAYTAVGCTILFGIYSSIPSIKDMDVYLILYILNFSLLTITSVIISISSFLPRLTPPFWIKLGNRDENDNPLFFGHSCKYSKNKYLELFDKSYPEFKSISPSMEIHICDQIVNNSRIAFIKYKMFNSAIWLFLAAILTPFGALLYWKVKE